MRKQKPQKSIVEHWRASLSPEEKRERYLKSIPEQVSASMAFEGEHVSLKMPKEYLMMASLLEQQPEELKITSEFICKLHKDAFEELSPPPVPLSL